MRILYIGVVDLQIIKKRAGQQMKKENHLKLNFISCIENSPATLLASQVPFLPRHLVGGHHDLWRVVGLESQSGKETEKGGAVG